MPKLFIIRHEGGSRILTVTRLIPESWRAVEIEAKKSKNGSITLKLNKVL